MVNDKNQVWLSGHCASKYFTIVHCKWHDSCSAWRDCMRVVTYFWALLYTVMVSLSTYNGNNVLTHSFLRVILKHVHVTLSHARHYILLFSEGHFRGENWLVPSNLPSHGKRKACEGMTGREKTREEDNISLLSTFSSPPMLNPAHPSLIINKTMRDDWREVTGERVYILLTWHTMEKNGFRLQFEIPLKHAPFKSYPKFWSSRANLRDILLLLLEQYSPLEERLMMPQLVLPACHDQHLHQQGHINRVFN